MLPYALLPICLLLGALTYRIRGGLWNTIIPLPGQVARATFGVAVALTALDAGLDWLPALLLVPAIWAGTTIPLFGSIDLGKNEGTFWGDFGFLTLRGFLATAPALPVLWWFDVEHFWVLGVFGALMGTNYWVARQLRSNVRGFGAGGDFPELGEAITGAVIALGAFVAITASAA